MSDAPAARRLEIAFDDNRLLPLLYGEHDTNLVRIETQLGVQIASRGNVLTITGPADAAETARAALLSLWDRLERSQAVGANDVDAAVRLADRSLDLPSDGRGGVAVPELTIRTRRRSIAARTARQAAYFRALEQNELTIAIGPAGTGKTYLAVAQAVAMLTAGRVDRIVLTRPAVEAGERLGFLPGDLREKVDPYLRPIYDALYDLLPAEQVAKRLAAGEIEIAPLAFMRGRTLANAFIILDEAQNTTTVQMKMALTRLGEHSRFVVTGDLTQVDLPVGVRSGLRDAVDILDGVDGVAIVRFGDKDIVRHPLVARIVEAYERTAKRRKDADGAKSAAPPGETNT
ncbi:MAG: phosphate starvation-inducible protein PhoH [Rhodospirillales bacterium]|jgi:phosphate starvation-inducible PhoH-like protein|nr:phosphate starvation-inducible protein PhoH [Rhodospirillales bacterium]